MERGYAPRSLEHKGTRHTSRSLVPNWNELGPHRFVAQRIRYNSNCQARSNHEPPEAADNHFFPFPVSTRTWARFGGTLREFS